MDLFIELHALSGLPPGRSPWQTLSTIDLPQSEFLFLYVTKEILGQLVHPNNGRINHSKIPKRADYVIRNFVHTLSPLG